MGGIENAVIQRCADSLFFAVSYKPKLRDIRSYVGCEIFRSFGITGLYGSVRRKTVVRGERREGDLGSMSQGDLLSKILDDVAKKVR